MAALEKLIKALDALKLVKDTSSTTVEDEMALRWVRLG